jgi:16S rRNA (guanine527-N7)-methyltransferase
MPARPRRDRIERHCIGGRIMRPEAIGLDVAPSPFSNVTVISSFAIEGLLEPFETKLSDAQSETLLVYLDLLVRWNKKINLTSVKKPEDCVQRHFGESFYLSKAIEVKGSLLDIGSGAGFPGLALKIQFPNLAVTLLEPVAKKRAFLKEAARACQMSHVEVLGDRLQDFANGARLGAFDIATARAVGNLDDLVPAAAKCLNHSGRMALWLGIDQISAARDAGPNLTWAEQVPVPLSKQRVILIGKLA